MKSLRSLLVLLIAPLLAAALAATLLSAPAQAAATKSKDFPRLPRYCATPQELIPQSPVKCELTKFKGNRPTVVLWGDSHAWMLIPALKAAVRNRNVNLVAFVMGSCPPMDPRLTKRTRGSASSCDLNNDMALRYVRGLKRGKERVQVVLNGSWQRYLHAVKTKNTKSYAGQVAKQLSTQTPRLLNDLRKAKISAHIVGQVATVPTRKAKCGRGMVPYVCNLPRSKALQEEASTRQALLASARKLPGNPPLIDVNPVMCNATVCAGKIKGKPTFYDDLHISASTAKRMRPYFMPIVRQALGR